MGNPKTDSGEQKNPSSGSGSAKGGSSSKQNPGKLPPAGFIYSDDENLMDELSMGWGLTASEEEDELDAVINKTVDMSKVSNTKLKALTEPPKSGVERIERVRAERASKEVPQQQAAPSTKETDEREAAAKRAKQAAAEREEAARAAAQREKAERELAAREAAEREAALKARAAEEARDKEAKHAQARQDKERASIDSKERADREARERLQREQEEEEARERAALEARLLKRAEQEAKEREQKEAKEREEREAKEREEREALDRAEREEEGRIAAAARVKAEKEAAEREEAEREIAERERLQKEAAAKLKARQEEARREAEEEEAREREEQERIERERQEKEQQEKERAEKEKTDKSETAVKETTASSVKPGRIESSKKEIKAQRIGGPKTSEEKKPPVTEPVQEEAKDKSKLDEPKEQRKEAPVMEKTGTTSRLSRTPEEELAALLAEDGDEPEQSQAPVDEPVKKPAIQPQDAKTSRSGLAAMEPTDDTPLTGVLKVIKPKEASKAPARSSDDLEETSEAKVELEAEKPIQSEEAEVAADTADDGGIAANESNTKDAKAAGLLSSDIVATPLAEAEAEVSASVAENSIESSVESSVEATVDESSTESSVPDFLKTDVVPKPDAATTEAAEGDKLGGVDKFYKPERVKLSDFVKKRAEGAESKTAEKPEKSEKPEKTEKPERAEKKDPADQAETAALQILKLPEPLAKSETGSDVSKSPKDEIRDSVKQESPEKKAAIIAALKKLEEQVDESDLDSLSTDSLKDVLAKLPDLGDAPPSATPGKKDGSRTRTPSPAVARLAPLEEPSPEREIAREKLKVMQKMAHTLPAVKNYLPQKRALLILAAVAILGTLAAVMTVRAETISARQALAKKDYNGALNSLGIALALYPLSAEAHFLKGSALYLTEKYNDAFNEYDTALKLNPGMRDALERRAAVSYKLGNYSQSVADYEKLLQQEGEQSQRFDQLLSLANAYLRVGDLQKAADMYNRCLDRKPNYIAAMIGKIAVSNEKRLYERAIIESGKALATSAGNKDVLILRARAYTGMRDFGNAQKDIDAVIAKNPKSGPAYAARANLRLTQKKNADAYADFEKAIKFSSKDSSILLDRAQAYIKDRKLDLAAKDIAKAKQLMGAQQTAKLYIINSQLQIATKQAPKALEDLKEAQEKFPRNADVILALADVLAATGKVGEGIMTTEKAMEMDKGDVNAIVKHGLLSVKFGNKMRAAEDFGEAIKLDPKNLIAYKERGMLYLQQEKFASAQEDLSKVVSLDPSQTDAKAALDKAKVAFAKITRVRSTGVQREGPSDAYLASLASKSFDTLMNDGFNAYKRGDSLTAVPTLEQAVKVNPKDARARRYLAYAYKQADQLGEAAGQFDVLYPLGGLGPQDTVTYIDMLMGSGQQDKAAKVIEDAIAKNPGNQMLYLHLANCQSTRGENAKAVQTCNRGIAINPRSAVGEQLIELRRTILGGGSPSPTDGGGSNEPPPGA